MWNGLTIALVALELAGVALVGTAAFAGLRLLARHRQGPVGLGERVAVDRQAALVTTAMATAALVYAALSPLWLWALASLVPHVQGGMCLAAIHHLGGPEAWIASGLKLLVPPALLYWVVADRLDRRVPGEHLVGHKLALLAPIAAFAALAAFFDLRVLLGLELGPSPCCMTLFDAPRLAAGPAGAPSWTGGAFFFAATAASTFAALLARRRRSWALAAGGAAMIAAGAWLVALHGALGSTWMHMPSHTCLFCVWRLEGDSVVATTLVLGGAWLTAARGTLIHVSKRRGGADALGGLGQGPWILLAGALWAAVRVCLVALPGVSTG